MSRAKTAEEVREEFLEHIRMIASYWANEIRATSAKERCDGVALSILNVFDGTIGGMPAFDIVVRPHPDDRQHAIDNNEDYYEDGMIINDCHLHEMY